MLAKCLRVMVLLAAPLSVALASVPAKIDVGHSQIGFTVKHLLISKVKGRFNKFDGTFTYDSKKKTFSDFKVTIDAASVDTNEPDRDKHLRNADFFDVDKHKTIDFKSTKIVSKNGKTGQIHGDLTMRGVTKPVVFDFTFTGATTDPWGNEKVALEAKTKLNRKEFGISWNKNLDKGGLAVSEDVEITVELEGNLETAKKAE